MCLFILVYLVLALVWMRFASVCYWFCCCSLFWFCLLDFCCLMFWFVFWLCFSLLRLVCVLVIAVCCLLRCVWFSCLGHAVWCLGLVGAAQFLDLCFAGFCLFCWFAVCWCWFTCCLLSLVSSCFCLFAVCLCFVLWVSVFGWLSWLFLALWFLLICLSCAFVNSDFSQVWFLGFCCFDCFDLGLCLLFRGI